MAAKPKVGHVCILHCSANGEVAVIYTAPNRAKAQAWLEGSPYACSANTEIIDIADLYARSVR